MRQQRRISIVCFVLITLLATIPASTFAYRSDEGGATFDYTSVNGTTGYARFYNVQDEPFQRTYKVAIFSRVLITVDKYVKVGINWDLFAPRHAESGFGPWWLFFQSAVEIRVHYFATEFSRPAVNSPIPANGYEFLLYDGLFSGGYQQVNYDVLELSRTSSQKVEIREELEGAQSQTYYYIGILLQITMYGDCKIGHYESNPGYLDVDGSIVIEQYWPN